MYNSLSPINITKNDNAQFMTSQSSNQQCNACEKNIVEHTIEKGIQYLMEIASRVDEKDGKNLNKDGKCRGCEEILSNHKDMDDIHNCLEGLTNYLNDDIWKERKVVL